MPVAAIATCRHSILAKLCKLGTSFDSRPMINIVSPRLAALFLRPRASGDLPHVNVSQTLALKQRLGCKPFAYFLHRFRKAHAQGLHGSFLCVACFRVLKRSRKLLIEIALDEA